MKYDFSDLQIIQTHDNTWGFHDLAAQLVRELSVNLSIFFYTGGVSLSLFDHTATIQYL